MLYKQNILSGVSLQHIFLKHSGMIPHFSMMTSSNGNIFHVTGSLCGEFIGHRWIPCTEDSDTELWCFLCSAPWMKERLSKQSRGWWFETPTCSLWCHCNDCRFSHIRHGWDTECFFVSSNSDPCYTYARMVLYEMSNNPGSYYTKTPLC